MTDLEKPTLYLAGGLFNAGQQMHNLYLEKHLVRLGFKVILPQREALKFRTGEHLDLDRVSAHCRRQCRNPQNLFVGCLDGADADSGTAVEFATAIESTGRAIVYRTDFRTDQARELGVNAMFKVEGSIVLIHECHITEFEDIDAYYAKLARLISEFVEHVMSKHCSPKARYPLES